MAVVYAYPRRKHQNGKAEMSLCRTKFSENLECFDSDSPGRGGTPSPLLEQTVAYLSKWTLGR
jgi:hypothetical protein